MEKQNKAISNKERLSDIKALKQRFKILNPKNLPEWIKIEAFALAENHLRTWLPENDNDIHSDMWALTEVELSRIRELAFGTNQVFKSQAMKDSWEKVEKVFPGEPVKSQAWFSIHLLKSFLHPHEITKTKTEAQKQKDTLLLTLEKALKLARQLPTNLAIEWRNEIRVEENQQGHTDQIFYLHPEGKIINLIEALKKSEISPGMLSKSVHGKTSSRLFFMRSLTSSFLNQTGKPYRKVVADTASAAFDCSLSETEIIRATKNVKLQLPNAMTSYLEEDTLNNLKLSELLKDPFSY